MLIHTNLGRAPLAKKALEKIKEVGEGYSTVEFNIKKNERGERLDHLEKLLCALTGAQSALVVNNNAAALFLCLNTLAFQKKVLISRSELVEIGSSFRIPDIMEKSGALLKEVGTTNKTRLKDYEKACDVSTSLFLKIHKSNYDIVGFTQEVPIRELAQLSRKRKKPLLFDAGSGLLFRKWPIFQDEPLISECIEQGADLITFSGDKLLGGPQAGLIVGKKKWIEKLKKNPLYRVLRVDKLLLTALEETLRIYTLPHPEEEIPFLKLLLTPMDVLRARAQTLKSELALSFMIIREDVSKVGGGAFPKLSIPTVALCFSLPKGKLLQFEQHLRLSQDTIPVIGRIQKECFVIDLRTVFESELSCLKKSLVSALNLLER